MPDSRGVYPPSLAGVGIGFDLIGGGKMMPDDRIECVGCSAGMRLGRRIAAAASIFCANTRSARSIGSPENVITELGAEEADLLRELGERLLKAETRDSATELGDLLTDGFLKFGSSGRVFD